ncbi:MAG: ABC transporter permease [Bacteroidota bacterium]
MTGAQDISWLDLMIGYLLIIIPIVIFNYFGTGMIKATLIAIARMTIQLFLVGLYLQYIFDYNSVWVNIGWVIGMIVIAAYTVIKRSNLNRKLFQIPLLISMLLSVLAIDVYFLGFVIKLDFIFDARYFIPITGMLIGNCLSNNIVALNTFYKNLNREQLQYRFAIANGATKSEALRGFIAEALKKSLNPTIATTAVVGLISLPGMMTGQILGGSNPSVAIKYQIMIMITILVSSLITVVLSILISNRFVFDAMDMPVKNIIVEK